MSWFDDLLAVLLTWKSVAAATPRLNGIRRSDVGGDWVLLISDQACVSCDGTGPCPFMIIDRLKGSEGETNVQN